MLTRLAIILVLALQPMAVLGGPALAAAGDVCAEVVAPPKSCCAMAKTDQTCGARHESCACTAAPTQPTESTPAPASLTGSGWAGLVMIVPEEPLRMPSVSAPRVAWRAPLAVATQSHNRIRALLGNWQN